MKATELLAELQRLEVQLTVDAGQLSIRAPKGALTLELQRAIRAQKPALLDLLLVPPGFDFAKHMLRNERGLLMYCSRCNEKAIWWGTGATPFCTHCWEALGHMKWYMREYLNAETAQAGASMK